LKNKDNWNKRLIENIKGVQCKDKGAVLKCQQASSGEYIKKDLIVRNSDLTMETIKACRVMAQNATGNDSLLCFLTR